ncbi:MAG: indolepyruvate ferredoxin oxidoreductase family protein [Defluviicoccus sp.]|nr:indolepyruvate ferredoxin oxidoreductase family protein [Defluviicoccus sp.]
MELAEVALDDKYALESGRVYMTGTQALVRLPLMQRRRDLAAGLNTAGFISGYRGSPLAGYDTALWRAKGFLEDNHVHFEPGVNEDLAATAVWGSQQVNLFLGGRYDGVFAIWYGKGPGLDRSMDAMRHASAAGTSLHGGVLALVGDDHGAVSSTLPTQSEHNFAAMMMPVLHPASVQEYLDFGLIGWAMSRYSGSWIGFKCLTETVESSASVAVDEGRVAIAVPADQPPSDVAIRLGEDRLQVEARVQEEKVYAALRFARANRIDRLVWDSPKPRLGILTAGKSYLDVRQALDDLGIDEDGAAALGIRIYKAGMVWPLERSGARGFADGLEEVLVVEEKRAVMENQLRAELYNWKESARPRIVGKFDEEGSWLLPAAGELTPAMVARTIARRIGRYHTSPRIADRLDEIEAKERALSGYAPELQRSPYFCSGCPHNRSTRIPEGSRAEAGIGCHWMALLMNRGAATYSHMGGEGANWIGQAPFTEQNHVFVNLGDGTYHHSGILAIRAAVNAGVNVTYKVLYNDAVAMTGGQPQPVTPQQIAAQVLAEGAARVAVVADHPGKYTGRTAFPGGLKIHHRDELDRVQRTLRDVVGVTVLIYDQTCAAELRRRRKRGTAPDPDIRAFINEAVCEGCGDCSAKSNCVSIEPLETKYGRKRRINQSACNKDLSCVDGFCPSFVTLSGARIRRARAGGDALPELLAGLPEPDPPPLDEPWDILVTGIGGTGVVTIGAILGMAAHLEGKGVTVLDQSGLAQKNGAVVSHVRIAAAPDDLHAVRIAAGKARLLLGCDAVTAGSADALAKLGRGRTRAVVNRDVAPTAAFTLDGDAPFDTGALFDAIRDAAGHNLTELVAATRTATALLGDSIATNMFMVGYAAQRGLIPVSLAALERAIELNGVAVAANREALGWGRVQAARPEAVADALAEAGIAPEADRRPETLEEIVEDRAALLTAWQDTAYAERYRALVARAGAADDASGDGSGKFTLAVARNAARVMAYKDEYEVARLYADPGFMAKLRAQFEGDFRLSFHLALPLLRRPDPTTGEPGKRSFGPWTMIAFRLLARLKGLRGGPFDPFARSPDRRLERGLVDWYCALVDELAGGLDAENYETAVALATLPEKIRGYGPVKARSVAEARRREAELRRSWPRAEMRETGAEEAELIPAR